MDVLKLDYERKKAGLNIDEFCEKIHMNKGTYYRKTRGESDFTRSEILTICEVLNLRSPMGIFFPEEVS